MNKKMRELLAKIEEKHSAVKDFLNGNETKGIEKDVDKATALLEEIKSLQKEFDAEKALYELEKAENEPTDEEAQKALEKNKNDDAVKKFIDSARQGFPKATMTEGTPADGGHIVPEDIRTQIETYRDAKFSLRQLVRVTPVTTNKGANTFKKRAQQTGFTKVTEGGKITSTSSPQFKRVSWEIEKYAGYLPVTNELLADTDANITNTIVEWLGDESRVTDNVNILAVAKTFTTRTINKASALDDIKKILNVDLGQAFKSTSAVVTNDDGLQFLDTIKDSDGNYVLQPNPADPMKMVLCAGANTIPVVVVPNADLATTGTKIPFFIGDMAEAIELKDRQQLSVMTSNTATIGTLNAFEQDLTIWRGILREDVVKRDSEALFFAELDTAGE